MANAYTMMPAFTILSGSVSNVCGWILKDLKLTAFVLSLVLFSCSFEAVNAVLPSYIPALGIAYYGRDSLVQQYYQQLYIAALLPVSLEIGCKPPIIIWTVFAAVR